MSASRRFLAGVVGLVLFSLPAWVGGAAQGKGAAYVNLGPANEANTWAVGQSVQMYAVVVPSAAVSTPVPTGTVQFYASGQPVGAPFTLNGASESEGIAIPIPGSYSVTASYSGDANYAPVNSTYSFPITVEYNPPTLLPASLPASLNFTAGATTGNTLQITMQQEGGCGCGAYWGTSIGPAPGTTMPAHPPSLTFGQNFYDGSGNWVYQVAVVSSAPQTVTRTSAAYGIGAVVLACVLLPVGLRRRRPVGLLFWLFLLGGCAGGKSPVISDTTTTTIPGSAGSYLVTIAGNASMFPGGITYFSVQVPVTIQ